MVCIGFPACCRAYVPREVMVLVSLTVLVPLAAHRYSSEWHWMVEEGAALPWQLSWGGIRPRDRKHRLW